jgi:hypothetical protein
MLFVLKGIQEGNVEDDFDVLRIERQIMTGYWVSTTVVLSLLFIQCIIYACNVKGLHTESASVVTILSQTCYLIIYCFHFSIFVVYLFTYAGLLKVLDVYWREKRE